MRHISLLLLHCLYVTCVSTGTAHAHANDTSGLSLAFLSKIWDENNIPLTSYADYIPTVSTTKGDVLLFVINVRDPGATEHQSADLKVKFSPVTNSSIVTNYPRVFMNTYHEINGPAAPDLALATRAEHAALQNTQGLTWSGSDILTVGWNLALDGPIYIYVQCNDPAAYGILTLQLRYHDEVHLPIPWDVDSNGYTPENYIADAYDGTSGYATARNAGNSTDNETGPGINMHPGDGLSYWEEYRGVVVEGVYTRLDPTVKDIFVHSGFSAEYPSLAMGTRPAFTTEKYGYASNLERIAGSPNTFKVHHIRKGKMGEYSPELGTLSTRFINFNSHAAYQVKLPNGSPLQQRAIHVFRDSRSRLGLLTYLGPMVRRQLIAANPDLALPENAETLEEEVEDLVDDIYGQTVEEPGYPVSPNGPAAIRKIEIFVENIRVATNVIPSEGAKIVIGHEIGHAISLWHTTNTGSIMANIVSLSLRANVFPALHNAEYNLYPQTSVTRPTRP